MRPSVRKESYSSGVQDEVRQALEDFRSILREDLRSELQEAVRDIQTMLSQTPADNLPARQAPVDNLPAPQAPRAETFSATPSMTQGYKDHNPLPFGSLPSHITQMVGGHPTYIPLEDNESDDSDAQVPGARKWVARAGAFSAAKDEEQGANIIESRRFETFVGVIVLANALFIGIEAETQCVYHMDVPKKLLMLFQVLETCFTSLYSIEWLLRIYFQRCDFFKGDAWQWNVFDTFLLMSQLVEKTLLVCMIVTPAEEAEDGTAGVLGLFRSLRLIRIARIVRLVRLFKDLGTLVSSIYSSFQALMWALTLMLTMVYGFSVFFAQRVNQAKGGYLSDNLDYFYRDVPRTALTMIECILGGLSWDDPVMSLFREVDMTSGCLCIIFIMIGLFVLVNIVTGVFIDKAMKTADAEEDRAIAEELAIAFGLSEDGIPRGGLNLEADSLDYQAFKSKIHEPAVHRYFEKIDLEVDEDHLRKFFNLLDTDGSGDVSAHEMYAGCLRLRGGLRAIDLALHTYDEFEFFRYQQQQLERIEQLVVSLSVTQSPQASRGTKKTTRLAI